MSFALLLRRLFEILLPLAVLMAAVYGAFLLFINKPKPASQPREEKPVLVELLDVAKCSRRIELRAYGEVQAHRTLEVSAQVPGRVVHQHSCLVVGGRIPAGAELVRLDDRDYKNEVAEAKARVATARFEWEVELGRQAIARREWEMLGSSVERPGGDERLALRTPHLEQRKAALDAAESALAFREVQLERTVIRSPFDALVLEEDVEVDRLLTTGTRLARLVATDRYRVVVSLPMGELQHLQFPDERGTQGSEVNVELDVGTNEPHRWSGHVERVLGEVSPQGRLARVMVLVEQPFQGRAGERQGIELLLGSYVEVRVLGPELTDLVALPRAALRRDDTVWLFGPDQRLVVRNVTVVRRTAEEAWISNGLEAGERVVLGALPTAGPGLLLAATPPRAPTAAAAPGVGG